MPNNSTMTDAAVMNVLFMKFQDLCRSGKDAHLSFESKWVFTSTFPQDIYAPILSQHLQMATDIPDIS